MHTRWMSAIFVNNGLVVSGQLGVWYGRIADNTNGTYQSRAQHRAEDSGRAADLHVPGGAYRSEENGYQALGRGWHNHGADSECAPYTYTSSATILAGFRARDAAVFDEAYGAGFEMTDNP